MRTWVLQRECRGASDADVGVTPATEPGVPAHVLVAHVVTADPRFLAIHDHDLPVVSEVDLEPVRGPLLRMEVVRLGPRLAQLLQVLLG
jgi:hypothetical protein